MFSFFGLSQYFDMGSSAFYFCHSILNAIGHFLWKHAGFLKASAFNGDLNKWNVANVTIMQGSKSIRIVENGLT
jgi:surface protein